MTEELKPCPFCGASSFEYGYWGWIGCQECGAKVAGRGSVDSRDAWNRRATPAPAQPEDASTDKYCAECRKTKGADPAKGAQEDKPVAQWQIRMNDDASWENIDAEDVKFCRARGYQVRALYDHAAPKEKP